MKISYCVPYISSHRWKLGFYDDHLGVHSLPSVVTLTRMMLIDRGVTPELSSQGMNFILP